MAKTAVTANANKGAVGSNAGKGNGLIAALLSFLQDIFPQVHPWVRDLIGCTILLLLAIYVLNGFVAPTVIRGTLYFDNAPTTGGWTVSLEDDQSSTVNENGHWVLYQRGLPQPLVLTVRDKDKNYIGEKKIFSLLPIWDAVAPPDYALNVPKSRNSVNLKAISSLQSEQTPASPVYAGESPTQNESKVPCTITLRGLQVARIPGFFRSTGRVYLSFSIDGIQVPDQSLVPFTSGLKFPLLSNKELWIGAEEKQYQSLSGFAADASALAECREDGTYKLKGNKVEVAVIADTGEEVSRIDISDLFNSPNFEYPFKSGDSTVSLGLTPSPDLPKQVARFGWVADNLYRGGWISALGLRELQQTGIISIIDLREPGNATRGEQTAAKSLGMTYVNIPVEPIKDGQSRTQAKLDAIFGIVASSKTPLIIHDIAGTDRVGVVIACYRMRHNGYSPTRALNEAVSHGLSDPPMEAFIKKAASFKSPELSESDLPNQPL